MSARWTEEEIDFLYHYAGEYPLALLTKKLNTEFSRNRTKSALSSKMSQLKLSSRPTVDFFSAEQWAKELGFNNSTRINVWVKKKGLKAIKLDATHSAITIRAMQQFAKRRPELFGHVPFDILLYYFGEEVTNKVANTPLKRYHPQPVIINGKQYSSIREASRHTHYSVSFLAREVKRPNSWIKKVEKHNV